MRHPMQVVCCTVYDVCIDYMLLDAFEDLGNPPATVVAVTQNRWLTTGFKETVRPRGEVDKMVSPTEPAR